jgi:hypothetical protein
MLLINSANVRTLFLIQNMASRNPWDVNDSGADILSLSAGNTVPLGTLLSSQILLKRIPSKFYIALPFFCLSS